jgi:AcrR family transcriptional regulator
MVTRRRTRSVDRILDAAADLFYESGIRGVGVDDVVAASGVSKSTLYSHFRTKDDLVAAYLGRTDVSWLGQLQSAAQGAAEPRDQLVALFDALGEAFDRHGFFGCPFVSAGVEAALDSAARQATLLHSKRRHQWLVELSREADAADPEQLASHLGLLVDGALAAGRLTQSRSVIDAARSAARAAVLSQTPQPTQKRKDQNDI